MVFGFASNSLSQNEVTNPKILGTLMVPLPRTRNVAEYG
jgi:hypothetical protein